MIYYNDIIFSREECTEILNSADKFVESGLDVVVNGVDYGWTSNVNKRKSMQCEKIALPGSLVYDRIDKIISKFDYKLMCDELNYDIIKYKEGDFIWKHKDDKGNRIFSFVIQLNEGDTYDGGEFKYWVDNNEFEMSKNIGIGMIFQAGVYHEVKPIIKGERHSFVSFLKLSDVKKIGKQALI
jgi:hypothetical protein